jgi:hypothetical protein
MAISKADETMGSLPHLCLFVPVSCEASFVRNFPDRIWGAQSHDLSGQGAVITGEDFRPSHDVAAPPSHNAGVSEAQRACGGGDWRFGDG